MHLSEWAKDLFQVIEENNSSQEILTKDKLARVLNEKYNIPDESISSFTTIGQFRHVETLLVELEMAKFVSIVGNVISLKK